MDLKVHENLEPIKDSDEKIEPEELLDECWFFGNLLRCNNSRMFRSLSEPCTSSNHCSKENIFGEKSCEETYESIKKLSGNGESLRFNLVKAPSLPASMKERIIHESSSDAKGGTDPGRSKSGRKFLSKNISRAPSLPTSLRTDEFQDEEVEFSMGKLIRQASMKNSDTMTHGVSPSYGIKRNQPRKKPEMDSIKLESLEETRTQPTMNQLRKLKSIGIMESKQMQDFGYDIKQKGTLNHHKISSFPGLREKHPLYFSEAGGTHSSAPLFPKWGGNKSTEAMKEQIKFWARAVASNVH